jgi:glycosyltransferase involved in cell wall biosynthesis
MLSPPSFSVCIPTFNRANYLKKLVNQLIAFIEEDKLDLEVCIADNCSDDNTWEFLQSIAALHPRFKIKRQDFNIGATSNLIDVTSMATSEWMMVIGDDDRFVKEGFIEFLFALPTINNCDYILLNSFQTDSKNLFDFSHGEHSMEDMLPVLKKSIAEFGFCGVHVFKQNIASQMRSVDCENIRPWPSFSTFIKHLTKNKIFFFSRPAVQQCGNGIALHWQPIHWLHLCIRQLVVLQINVSTASQDHKKSLNKIVLSNLWSLNFLKVFYAALLYLPLDTRAILKAHDYKNLLTLTGGLLIKLHSIAFQLLSLIPISIHYFLVSRLTAKDINDYKFNGEINKNDGFDRFLDIINKVDVDGR